MKPPDYSRSLYFTPRTPWGRRPQKRPGQGPNYLRASEDKPAVPSPDEKHKLWGTEQQGLGAQMATSKSGWRNGSERTLDRLGVPRELSGEITPQKAAGTYDKLAMFPPSAPPAPQPSQPQVPTAAHLMGQGSSLSTQQQRIGSDAVGYPAEPKAGWSLGGKISYGRTRPKDGPTEASIEAGMTYGTPAVKEQLEKEEQENRKISPNQTGEEQEGNYYGR